MLREKDKRSKKDKAAEPAGKSIGKYLKEAREKAAISHEQLYEKTKLRVSVIEDLEEERWDRLPSRVFVKGFIKSYAAAVGLDPEDALAVYEQSAPETEHTFKPISETKPQRPLFPFLLGGLLAVLVVLFFIWGKREPVVELGGQEEPLQLAAQSESSSPKEAPSKEPSPAPKKEPEAPPPQKQAEESFSTSKVALPGPEEVSPEQSAPPPEQAPPTPLEEQAELVEEGAQRPLVLRAFVKERTWVRIQVDGGLPKEYIFSPGAQPQWKGNEVFDIMIGNAAGIDLELEGKRLTNLGKRGQVVRLVLPED